jgi:hypothetical protein
MYGKEGCVNCERAEDKLKRLGIEYSKVDLQSIKDGTTPIPDHDTRARLELVEAGIQWAEGGEFLPVFVVDGVGVSYPAAMGLAKGYWAQKRHPQNGPPRAPIDADPQRYPQGPRMQQRGPEGP